MRSWINKSGSCRFIRQIKKKPLITLNLREINGFMPAAGLEPARGCPRQILSLMRLPFRHAGALHNGIIVAQELRFGKQFL